MKDKLKPIDDNSAIQKINPVQPITINCNACVICGMDLSKRGKEHIINGVKYVTISNKKYYKLWGKQVCWNCVFNLIKQFKLDSSH